MTANWRQSPEDEEKYKFDPYAHAVTVISEPHRLIHDGMFFDLSGIVTGLANAATLDILFQFPVGSVGHLVNVEYQLDDAPCKVEFFEAPTFSAAGSALAPVNHNRMSTLSADVTITQDPTVSATGTLLHERYIPSAGGTGGRPAGRLVEGEDHEWVLGNGKDYIFRLTNNSGGAITAGYHFNGYQLAYDV